MKFFTNKETSKKIIIVTILITIFNFVSPIISSADLADAANEFGGALFKPISQLLLAVSDLVIEGLQKIFIGSGEIEVVNSRK